MNYIDNDVAKALFQALLDEGFSEEHALDDMNRQYDLRAYDSFQDWYDDDKGEGGEGYDAEPETVELDAEDDADALYERIKRERAAEPKTARWPTPRHYPSHYHDPRDRVDTIKQVATKEDAVDDSAVKATTMIFQDVVKKLDQAFKSAETVAEAIGALESSGLPFSVGSAPNPKVDPIKGDFSKFLADGAIMRSSVYNGVQYTSRPKGDLVSYWVTILND
jgi:hypothetical protein